MWKFLIGGDLLRSRQRMRNAWIAGFAAAAINLAVALMSYLSRDPEGHPLVSGWQFAFLMTEAALLAALSWGVVKRQRVAAAGLFLYFALSEAAAYALGWGNWTALPVRLLLGYLMFQGMRGAFTYYQLTHPAYPEAPSQTNT
ncbi:MAG: hypothetical protein FJ316_04320 [SAR202 cluster bacterium]|nr:hypothetical protein [SAR202 cluster bacterium]